MILMPRRFKAKKSYGNYKTSNCPFCGKIATQRNEQGMDVCRFHVKTRMQEIKCACGSWLETKSGKFGPYFHCINCGNINYKKGLEMKSMTTPTFHEPEKSFIRKEFKKEIFKEKKEITITSNDVEYFD